MFLDKLLPWRPKRLRPSKFHGHFYPADFDALTGRIDALIADARDVPAGEARALVLPFAELDFAGPVCAPALAMIARQAEQIERVVIIAASHMIPFQGVAVPTHDAWDTPIGAAWIDEDALLGLVRAEKARYINGVIDAEPALEITLPMLQRVLRRKTRYLPLLVGDCKPDTVLTALEDVATGPETLVVILTELAHSVAAPDAADLASETIAAIEALDPDPLTRHHVTARMPLKALLTFASARGWTPTTLQVTHSRQVEAGARMNVLVREEALVVGYGSFAFTS